jgi:hypothetical protein
MPQPIERHGVQYAKPCHRTLLKELRKALRVSCDHVVHNGLTTPIDAPSVWVQPTIQVQGSPSTDAGIAIVPSVLLVRHHSSRCSRYKCTSLRMILYFLRASSDDARSAFIPPAQILPPPHDPRCRISLYCALRAFPLILAQVEAERLPREEALVRVVVFALPTIPMHTQRKLCLRKIYRRGRVGLNRVRLGAALTVGLACVSHIHILI